MTPQERFIHHRALYLQLPATLPSKKASLTNIQLHCGRCQTPIWADDARGEFILNVAETGFHIRGVCLCRACGYVGYTKMLAFHRMGKWNVDSPASYPVPCPWPEDQADYDTYCAPTIEYGDDPGGWLRIYRGLQEKLRKKPVSK